MRREELIEIKGGASISGTVINALVKGLSVIVDLGRSLGSAIRRYKVKEYCAI